VDVGGAAIAGRSLGDAAALRARQPWRPGAPLTGDGSVGGERLEGPPREIRALPSTRWIAGGLSLVKAGRKVGQYSGGAYTRGLGTLPSTAAAP